MLVKQPTQTNAAGVCLTLLDIQKGVYPRESLQSYLALLPYNNIHEALILSHQYHSRNISSYSCFIFLPSHCTSPISQVDLFRKRPPPLPPSFETHCSPNLFSTYSSTSHRSHVDHTAPRFSRSDVRWPFPCFLSLLFAILALGAHGFLCSHL